MRNFILISLISVLALFSGGCKPSKVPSEQSQSKADLSRDKRENYLQSRADLQQADQQLAAYAQMTLSPDEQELNARLKALQQSMIKVYRDSHFFPPARNFYQSKSHIEHTQLYSLLRKMPKGGLLHLHPPAAGQADWIIEKALSMKDCYVFWDGYTDKFCKGQIAFYKSGHVPKGFYSIQQLARDKAHFKEDMHQLLTLQETLDADSVDIWKEFEFRFQRLFTFTRHKDVFKEFYRAALDSLVADGVQHVEFRSMYGAPVFDLDHEPGYYTVDSTVRYLKEIEAEIQQKEPAFTLRTIYTDLRFKPSALIGQSLVEAYQLRKKYPDFVRGFDLVAEEDAGNTTRYFLDIWLQMDSLEKIYEVDMPLYFHGGESDWASLDNLYDVILLNSRRIGHGFNLFRFPGLMEEVKRRNICLEINPLSNQILGYIRDLRLHPAHMYLQRGIPVTISSDDPLVFDYTGLTYDYWTAFMAWELDIRALKLLALHSLEYSCLDEDEKKAAIKVWKNRWSAFVSTANKELAERKD